MSGGKPSKVEHVKRASSHLRGTIRQELDRPSTHFSEEDYQLLKFHGTYQQHDRDTATRRKQQGLEKEHQFMVRVRIPAGRLAAAQYLHLDDLAGKYANGTLRITTRQGLQFHGVLKGNLERTIAEINATLLTTLGACGDVVRNLMAPPAPIRDSVHQRLAADALRLSRRLLPRTRAYHEIWLDGERLPAGAAEEEPLYGDAYLPRKFKIALCTPDDNSVDVLANDIGTIALFEGDALVGYNFALGGGLGMTHNKPETYPRLATLTAFVEPDDLIRAVEAVIKLQRDHGDRSDRRRARLKYLIDDKGLDWIKSSFESYFGGLLAEPRPMPPLRVADHMGWHDQGDGRRYLGIPVESGRIRDGDEQHLRSGLREVVAKFGCNPILMPSQDILLSDIAPEVRASIERELRDHGIILASDITPVRRWALACPALPTCGLALTEAERVQQPLVANVEAVLKRYGLVGERLSIRMTGCPNGCARPYTGDIGIVGRMPGYYALYVGGDFEGTRLSYRLLDKVALADIPDTLEPLFADFARHRNTGEGFGDFCDRVGAEHLQRLVQDNVRPLPQAG
jgi:sulfite reductase (ferredoxin)